MIVHNKCIWSIKISSVLLESYKKKTIKLPPRKILRGHYCFESTYKIHHISFYINACIKKDTFIKQFI